MSALDKARRLLRRPAAWIEQVDGSYVIRLSPTRRARAAQVIYEETFRALCETPGLATRPGGGWRVQAAPVEGSKSDLAGRPGFIEGRIVLSGQDGIRATHRANLGRSAIRWLAQRRDPTGAPYLDPVHVAAAERLELDAETAFSGPSVTLRWDGLPRRGGGGAASRGQPGDRQMAAAARVESALAACGTDRRLVEAICIHATALQAAERDLGLGRRRGRLALRRGLEALARHYRV